MSAKQKITQKHSHKHALILGAIVLIVITLCSVQAALNYYFYKELEQSSSQTITTLVRQSVEDMMSPMTVDPRTGGQYVPSARLVFPAEKLEDPLQARVAVSSEDKGGVLVQLTTLGNLRNASNRMSNGYQSLEERFAHVPGLQACTRQITVSFAADIKGYAEKPVSRGSKSLKDGRTAYFYEDEKCPSDANRLIDFVQKVESY